MEPRNTADEKKYILVTGGAGFIGSHTVVELLEAGYDVIVIDNMVNSNEESMNRVKKITGKEFLFFKVDIRDQSGLEKLFASYTISAVIHFAGLKAVGESVSIPLHYYQNNIYGTLVLLEVMGKYKVKNMVFSSSATVYGDPHKVPINEDFPLQATNPYGRTKLFIEDILRDLCKSDPEWNCVILRYFNPIGAHPSGTIGEDPRGIPNNLVPYITQVAIGRREYLSVYGNDYATVDGTGVRDYIHVVDLAKGHIAALRKVEQHLANGASKNEGMCEPYNLGTGHGYSVLQMVDAIKKASGKDIPYRVVARRPGDVAECYADASKAASELGWKATLTLTQAAQDAWRWQSNNPNGFHAS